MIVTTYVCDNCSAQSPTGTGYASATVPASSGVATTALLCPNCLSAALSASQAALIERKATQTGVTLP